MEALILAVSFGSGYTRDSDGVGVAIVFRAKCRECIGIKQCPYAQTMTR